MPLSVDAADSAGMINMAWCTDSTSDNSYDNNHSSILQVSLASPSSLKG